jgi:CheY-like chemotaxis protein
MSAKILLVTATDETHRKPLLESEGYDVTLACVGDACNRVRFSQFALVLIPTDSGIENTLALCENIKAVAPEMRVAVIADRAEYIPPNVAVDAIVRQQHSPGKFLAAVRRLLDISPLGQSHCAGNGK